MASVKGSQRQRVAHLVNEEEVVGDESGVWSERRRRKQIDKLLV